MIRNPCGRSLLLAASAVATLAALSAACREGDPQRREASQAKASPVARIVLPGEGDTLIGPDVRIFMTVQHIALRPAGVDEPESGHLHLFVDRAPTPEGEVIPSEPGIVHVGQAQTAHVLEGLEPGDHEVIAVLGDYLHARIPGSRTDTVRFTIWSPRFDPQAPLSQPAVHDSLIDRPEFRPSDAGPRVALPSWAWRLLADYDAPFETWTLPFYPPGYVLRYRLNEKQAPFAVIGDLDGDGSTDVVLDGRAGDHVALVALLSGSGEPLRVEIHGGSVEGWVPARGTRGTALQYIPPGAYTAPDYLGQSELILETDAFEYIILEQAAEIYYWKDGRFQRYATAD